MRTGQAPRTRSINALVSRDHPFPDLVAGKAALLIVDMTYKDAHPDFGIGRLLRQRGWDDIHRDYYARVGSVVANIRRIRAASRKVGITVIHTRVASSTADCGDMGRAFKRIGVESPAIWAPAGSKEAQILDELAPEPADIVLSKTTGRAYNSTNIDWILRNMGVESLITTGVAVYDGAFESQGYEGILISDATTALTVPEHEDLLRRWSRVRSTEEVIDALKARTGATPARA